MNIQLGIKWEVVPVPIETVLNNSPLVVGILTYAYALLQSDSSATNYQTLINKVVAWSNQTPEAIESVLRQGFGISNKRLFQQIPNVPAPVVTAKGKADKPKQSFVPITNAWVLSLQSQYPGIGVLTEYAHAKTWYAGKGIPFSQQSFLKWLDRVNENSTSTTQVAQSVCSTCEGTQTIMGIAGGIPVEQDCPDCINQR